MNYYIIDPVHGSIQFDAFEKRIIDSVPMQRLRRIKQLGHVHMVFPGATHTRFSHSLGVMHVAGRIFDALFPESSGDEARAEVRKLMRLAGLLHDVGHGPFSHAFEMMLSGLKSDYLDETLSVVGTGWMSPDVEQKFRVSKLKHEHYTYGVARVLGTKYGFDSRSVCALLESKVSPSDGFLKHLTALASSIDQNADAMSLLTCLRSLLSGDIDADRLDYLARDSFHCGISGMAPDIGFILGSIKLAMISGEQGEKKVRVFVERSGISAVERVLISRKLMFDRVYSHRINASFDRVLRNLLSEEAHKKAIKAPASYAEFIALDDVMVEKVVTELSAVPTEMRFGDNPLTWGWMFLTRTPLVRVHEVVVPKLEQPSKEKELRAVFDGAVIQAIDLKAFTKAQRDGAAGEDSPMMVVAEYGKEHPPRALEQVSEVIRSNLWRTDLVKLVVFKSFEQSAAERGLAEKVKETGRLPAQELAAKQVESSGG